MVDFKKICAVCGMKMNKNHLRIHNLSRKEYYDLYIKSAGEGLCTECKIPTTYANFNRGYVKNCMPCANRLIGNRKAQLYKDRLLLCICKICGVEFKYKKFRDICVSHKCRKHTQTNPISDYTKFEFSEYKRCPYCNTKFKQLSGFKSHLSSHFSYNDVNMILQYIGVNIWKIPIPKCKYCNSLFTEKYSDKFYNSVGNCCQKCFDSKIWMANEFRDRKTIGKKIGESRKISNKTEKGKAILKRVGEINSKKMQSYLKTDIGKESMLIRAKKNSVNMKRNIAEGKFTPCITNSWTHWIAQIKLPDGGIKKFRSSWEACVWNSNKHLEYETVRIKYQVAGEYRNYVADFYDRETNTIYEVKPKKAWDKVCEKMEQVLVHCTEKMINFIWINEDNILSYINTLDFEGDNLMQLNKLYNGITQNKN